MRSAGESSEWRIVKLALFEVGSKQVVIIVEFGFEYEFSRRSGVGGQGTSSFVAQAMPTQQRCYSTHDARPKSDTGRKHRFADAVVMMMNKELAFLRAFDSRVESRVRSIIREIAPVECPSL
jgi:hypothetical protein